MRILAILALTLSCTHTNKPHPPLETYPPQGVSKARGSYISSGAQGMVVAAHPLATEAGLAILKKGGNAIDAAIAVSMAISVVRPQSTGIGGGGFLLYYDKENDKVSAHDFREVAPQAATRDMYLTKSGSPKDFIYKGKRIPNASVNGHLSAGVPGLIKGLWEIHRKSGKLNWHTLIEPAISLAENGFLVYPNLAKAIDRRKSILRSFSSTKRIFFPTGKPLKAGEVLIQTDLAKTLRSIAKDGDRAFYHGWIAKKIVSEMKKGGGIISSRDLAKYRPVERLPIQSTFHDIKIFAMPPPSSGGVHVAQMLNILEELEIDKIPFQSPLYFNLLTESMRHAYADRAKYLGDPDFVDIPTKGLISKEYAGELAANIKRGRAGDSNKIGAGNPAPYESPSTTHFSIVDRWGNGVSSTQTINYTFGSGVVVEGTGIILNDEMDDFSKKPGVPNAFGLVGSKANEIQPGKRMLSSMSPTLIFRNGTLDGIVGSPGGSRIINATLQTILHRYAFNISPKDSVHSFRIHHQWLPDKLYLENPKRSIEDSLKAMGYRIERTPWPIGDIQSIFKSEEKWIGVSDTRSDGKPMGY